MLERCSGLLSAKNNSSNSQEEVLMVSQAQVAQIGGVPVLILKEGTRRTVGKEALRNNILAARSVAEAVRTTLGPRGMDKMLVDSLGDITITNDGATILDEMEVQHPAAKMLVEVAKAQDEEVGDGTTTAVVLAGELLREAEDLLDKNIHPSTIIAGYRKAAEKAIELLNELSIKVDLEDMETLKDIASTSMGGKIIAVAKEKLAEIAVNAIKQIAEKVDGKYSVDKDHVQIIKKQGGSVLDTELVYGMIIDKEVVHPGMPKRVKNAKIALLNTPLEIEKTEIDAEIRISDPSQMRAFLEEEERMLKAMVDKIVKVGANVVICQKGIDDVAQHYLAKAGVLAVRRVKKSDMEKLARATGGKIVTNIDDLSPQDLGEAELVEERKIGEDKLVFIEGCKNPKAISILIRGGLERIVDEAERAMIDALSVVADVFQDPRIVAGGGAIEVELSKRLYDYATKIGGREQLAIEAFARALETIPRTLAESAGLEPIDVLAELRSVHEKEDGLWYGVNVFSGKVEDMLKLRVLEPVSVKIQAIRSAVEAASMILRVDDVIAAARTEESKSEESKSEESSED